MHINDVLFLQTIPKQEQELCPCSCSGLSLPGSQVFSYSNRTQNPILDLAIPVSFIEFPGSLHPLICVSVLFSQLLEVLATVA